jgi:hypothetical protein
LNVFSLLPLILPIGAWIIWWDKDRHKLVGVRRIVALIGLLTASLTLVSFALTLEYAHHIGGFATRMDAGRRWLLFNHAFCLLALLLACVGVGKSRVLGVLSAIVAALLFAGSASNY